MNEQIMIYKLFKSYLLTIVLIFTPSSVSAETDVDILEAEHEQVMATTLEALQLLLQSSNEKAEDISTEVLALKKNGESVESKETVKTLDELEEEFRETQLRLETIATGISVSEYHNIDDIDKFELQTEIERLLQPMVYALLAVTKESRQIEQLKQGAARVEQHLKVVNNAVERIDDLLTSNSNEELSIALKKIQKNWLEEKESLDNELIALDSRLQNKLASKESLITSTGKFVGGFFKNRGVNFVLGVMAFLSVFLTMRLLKFLYVKLRYKDEFRKRTSFERLFELIFLVLSVTAALLAMLLIFNIRHDWLLMGLATLFLVAIGWMILKSLPLMFEQVMLLLNLGSVREDERIIFHGVPWKVENLSFYSTLSNPVLSGGKLQISIRELVGMVSRSMAKNEEWFPSKEGDWVKLDNDVIGRVVYQNPEMVEIVDFGNSKITYSTETYLSLNPMNLSKNYRIQTVFGIDYRHKKECITEIPKKMCAILKQDLIDLLGEDQVMRVTTDFFMTNNSSLDYEYEAYIKGSSAHMYEEVERVIIYAFAKVCNKYGLVIPFPQLTLHGGMDIHSNNLDEELYHLYQMTQTG